MRTKPCKCVCESQRQNTCIAPHCVCVCVSVCVCVCVVFRCLRMTIHTWVHVAVDGDGGAMMHSPRSCQCHVKATSKSCQGSHRGHVKGHFKAMSMSLPGWPRCHFGGLYGVIICYLCLTFVYAPCSLDADSRPLRWPFGTASRQLRVFRTVLCRTVLHCTGHHCRQGLCTAHPPTTPTDAKAIVRDDGGGRLRGDMERD